MEDAEIDRKRVEKLEVLSDRIFSNRSKFPWRESRGGRILSQIKNVEQKRAKYEILEKMNSVIYIFLNLNNH